MKTNNPKMIKIDNDENVLAVNLLNGPMVSYHDCEYEVTAGNNEILMKLYYDQEKLVIFYIQIPFGYPVPDGLKTRLKLAFESTLNKNLFEIEYVNAATEAQKRNIYFRIQRSSE